MKKALVSMSVVTLLAAGSIPAQAQENMIYVPVNPCRLVDTRAVAGGFAIPADTSLNFLVSGTVASQGGNAAGCPAPRPGVEPLAISAYVLAIPPNAGSAAGILTAYPSDQPPPPVGAGSTVNFAAGQVIGNTTNITLCDPATATCPADGEFAILARTSAEHVVVDVQGYFYPATGTCPDDMVAVGSLCVDKYEASVTNAAGDTQYGLAGDDYPCSDSGSTCGAAAANPIFARSLASTQPSADITWYQALQACANVGKRLPSSAEWQTAASGSPSGNGGGCNLTASIAVTGSLPACVSSTGAFDMIGNLWEWVADSDNPTAPGFNSSITSQAWAMGDGIGGQGDATTRALWVETTPNTSATSKGFRCVQ